MEKAINAKISGHISDLKKTIAEKIKEYDNKQCSMSELLETMYNYPHLTIEKQDLQKRKRVKNSVPFHERCLAIRANNQQCTRRRRDNDKLCGTHIKGTPHGIITNEETKEENVVKVQVWAEEISGIIYHLDDKGNVYNPQDIFQNNKNPKIIAHYEKRGDEYRIIDQ